MHLLIPVKRFSLAKSRLAPALGPALRARLAAAMLEDLLERIATLHDVGGVTLVSDEPSLAPIAARAGVCVMPEAAGCHGLNPVLGAASAALAQRGVRRLMLLHGDIPLADPAELQALVDRHGACGGAALVLVPDARGSGTNVMVCDAPLRLALQYGEQSFARHRAQAAMRGLSVVERPASLQLDVDHEADLHALLRRARGSGLRSRAAALLRDWDATPCPDAAGLQPSVP